MGRRWMVGLLALLAGGCGGGGAAEPARSEAIVTVSAVQIRPNAVALAVGQQAQVQALAVDQHGAPIAGAQPVFDVADPAVATVSAGGAVTGVAPGSTTLRASVTWQGATRTASAPVTVQAPPAPGAGNVVTTAGTSFLPTSITIAANDSVTWEFTGAVHNVTFTGLAPAGGNIPDTSPGGRATRVFNTPGTYGYDCTRHAGMTATVVVTGAQPARFASLVVAPGTPAIQVGGTVQLAATPLDQNGSAMTGLPAPTYTTGAPAVASVSAAGLVTGVGAGTATITASVTSGGVTHSASAVVTVSSPQAAGPTITTPSNTFSPGTITIQQGETVTWQFGGSVHNVTFNGAVPAGGNIPDQQPGNAVSRTFGVPGTYGFDCTRHSGMSGQVVVQGSQPAQFTSVTVSPTSPAVAVGGTVQLTAVGRDQNGTAMAGLPAATFLTNAASIATVSGTGLVTGAGPGTATITASITSGGVTHAATATVVVTGPQAGPTITTPNNSFSPGVTTIQQGETVTWQFSGSVHNVTFNGAGPAGGNIPDQQPGNAVSRTFTTAGTYAFDCTRHSGMSAQIVVQGTQPAQFSSLGLSPATPSLPVGGTVQLVATPRDQNGNAMSGLPVPGFVSAAPGVATVSAAGLVTAVAAGTATVTASLTVGGVTRSATAAVTVTSPQAAQATFTTPNNSFNPGAITIPQGGTVTWQFSGAVHNVTFSGPSPAGGNIPDQQPGNAVTRTFPTPGTYPFDCTRHSGMTGQVIVQGSQPAQYTSLAVSPATPAIQVGGSVQLTATPKDQNGTAMSGLPAPTYATSAAGVATVSATGLVAGVGAGTAVITATVVSGGASHSATATVTVTVPTASSVTVTTPGNSFNPSAVTIPVGGTVTWQFSGTHNVTFAGTAPTGGNIPDQAAGNAVSRTFGNAGVFDYQCTRHNGMTGRVTVQAPPSGGGGAFASLGLAPASVVLSVGGTATLTATPLDAAGTAVAGLGQPTFASDHPAVATVTAAGIVTAVGSGTATITATLTAGSVTRTAAASVVVMGGAVVAIATPGSTFSPEDVQVAPGTTVVWQFSGTAHNVTFKNTPPAGGNIPDTAPGNAVARTFSVIGDYDYTCTIHKGMKGRIRVK